MSALIACSSDNSTPSDLEENELAPTKAAEQKIDTAAKHAASKTAAPNPKNVAWASQALEMSDSGARASGLLQILDPDAQDMALATPPANLLGGPDKQVNSANAVASQSETSIVGNNAGTVLIAGYNDARGFIGVPAGSPLSLSGVARSLDGGTTWSEVLVGPNGSGVLPHGGGQLYGDPDVKYDPTRDIFVYASIFVRPSDNLQGMSVNVSNADGSVWSLPRQVTPSFITGEAADKEFIDVDPVTGRIHITWTQFSGNPARILHSFSDDAGLTWSPATVLQQAAAGASVQASMPRVLPGLSNADATVYAVWRTTGVSSAMVPIPPRNIACSRSTNGGVTWDAPVYLDTDYPAEDQILGMDRVNNSPAMAVDAKSGRVYVVYQRNNAVGTGDIALRTFVGACQTGAPVLLNSDPGNDRAQFVPFVTVDQVTQAVHVGYYDQDTADSGDVIEVTRTYSSNQGVTWSPPVPVTDRAFHAGFGNDTSQPNLGDYNQAFARNGKVYTLWGGTSVMPLFDEGQAPTNGTQMFTPDVDSDVTDQNQTLVPLRVSGFTTSDTTFCASGSNGLVDPGEIINLDVKLQNYVANATVGAATQTGITAKLSTTTPGVVINRANATYADLAPLGSGSPALPFAFTVNAGFVPGTYIDFLVSLKSNQGTSEYPVRVATGSNGTTATMINEDFTVTTIGTAANPAGWQSVIAGGGASAGHWTVNQLLTPGNNSAYHSEAALTSWIRLYSPIVVVPAQAGESKVTLDFDLVYDLEEEASKAIEAYDGMTIRLTDSTSGATVRSVLAEAFAQKLKTNNTNHFPKHLIRNNNTNYLQDMSVWSGKSNGVEHISMEFPGAGMTGRSVQIRFEYTQDGFGVCTDLGAGRGPCGIGVDNVNFSVVPLISSTCTPATAVCGDGILQTGESCDDGNTTNGDCCSSTCQFESAGTVCRASAGQCDVQEVCDGAGFCPADIVVPNGTSCNDGNSCTQTDACSAGLCNGTNPIACAPLDQCHVAGTCDPATGACSNPNAADGTTCSDGDSCTQTDTCQTGTCTGASPVVCTATDQCHIAGTCDPATGVCSNPNAADGTTCSDGDGCTQTDTCTAGTCSGANPVTCTALDQCHVAGTCDSATGTCSNPTVADGTACDDTDACTQTDACQAGACTGSNPITCTASDQCHVAGTCDPATGTCSDPAAADGTLCDDADACTQTDACQAGTCAGGNPVECMPSDNCHVAGTCDPATGTCSDPEAPDGTACDDGDVCNGTEACQTGICSKGESLNCDDKNDCTTDTCDPVDGCKNVGECDAGTGEDAGNGEGIEIKGSGLCTISTTAPTNTPSRSAPLLTLLALLGLGRRRK